MMSGVVGWGGAGGGVGGEQWQVPGSAAEVYERELVPAIFEPWAPRVVALAAPAAGERVLDGQVLGLQYFPDRPAALAEMARVLAPGGRLAAMVWRSIDHSPGFAVLAEALDRHIGPEAGATMRAPFALGGEAGLRDLVGGAGFRDVRVDREAGAVRFGSVRELVIAQGAGSPLAGPIGAAEPAARAGLLAEVEAALGPRQGPAGLSFPIEALLVSGRR